MLHAVGNRLFASSCTCVRAPSVPACSISGHRRQPWSSRCHSGPGTLELWTTVDIQHPRFEVRQWSDQVLVKDGAATSATPASTDAASVDVTGSASAAAAAPSETASKAAAVPPAPTSVLQKLQHQAFVRRAGQLQQQVVVQQEQQAAANLPASQAAPQLEQQLYGQPQQQQQEVQQQLQSVQEEVEAKVLVQGQASRQEPAAQLMAVVEQAVRQDAPPAVQQQQEALAPAALAPARSSPAAQAATELQATAATEAAVTAQPAEVAAPAAELPQQRTRSQAASFLLPLSSPASVAVPVPKRQDIAGTAGRVCEHCNHRRSVVLTAADASAASKALYVVAAARVLQQSRHGTSCAFQPSWQSGVPPLPANHGNSSNGHQVTDTGAAPPQQQQGATATSSSRQPQQLQLHVLPAAETLLRYRPGGETLYASRRQESWAGLAGAVGVQLKQSGCATIQAAGAGALHGALQALAAARMQLQQRGADLVVVPRYQRISWQQWRAGGKGAAAAAGGEDEGEEEEEEQESFSAMLLQVVRVAAAPPRLQQRQAGQQQAPHRRKHRRRQQQPTVTTTQQQQVPAALTAVAAVKQQPVQVPARPAVTAVSLAVAA